MGGGPRHGDVEARVPRSSNYVRQMNAFSQSLGLLRTQRFGTFWFASLLSNIGTRAQQVAEPWLLFSLGASPFVIGLDTFVLGVESDTGRRCTG
jgi:hypothetical protein